MDSNQTILDQEVTSAKYDPRDAMASGGKRFANYLIDLVVLYAIVFVLGIIISAFGLTLPDEDLIYQLAGLVIFALYCFIFESSSGRTVGKFITKTRVVNDNGEHPGTTTILKRSFFRIVPFDQVSFLGGPARGWHDRWSDTWVIDDKKLAELSSSLSNSHLVETLGQEPASNNP